ncbi:hypothetical protein GCM10025865_22290 [Paraoerskovia sediminicola]|uniref:Transcription regulator PadR N-terminal domain-containing protein n=2 Tax=Paraoerskovia sediminicola TaxID=1138587 RepID=A0ABN6XGK1_9CELL|nr:hypothetical protein GCM10025865_22290 [Paraoerskovia sediminicola]
MPVFAHGELRLYLLALLATGPRHGYEIITELAERFGGTYRPSAGTVYPRLSRLVDDGLVVREEDGRRSTYALTPAGRAELEARAGDLAALEAGIAVTVRDRAAQLREEVRGSARGLRAELAAAAQEERARASSAPGSGADAAGEKSPSGTGRDDSAGARAMADEMLTRFRAELRADLRHAAADGRLGPLTVDTLRTVLDEAGRAVRATL